MEQESVQPQLQTQTSRVSQLSVKLKGIKRVGIPVRILIAVLGVCACILLSSTRYNLSIAIIPMVQDSCTVATSICADDIIGEDILIMQPPLSNSSLNNGITRKRHRLHHFKQLERCDGVDMSQKLNWTEAQQGLALGAYYYGFATTHIFGGRLAERSRWGPKWITALGLVGAAVFNAILPVTARLNFVAFVVIR